MDSSNISYVLVSRKSYQGGKWDKYLDYGWICKYAKSKATCIDFNLENETDFVAIAHNDKGAVVGVLKFDYNSRWKRLHAMGTWVRPTERKLGIGKNLWRLAVAQLGIRRVKVMVVSDGGFTLVQSLKQTFPNVAFDMVEEADRKLRQLRKGERRAVTQKAA